MENRVENRSFQKEEIVLVILIVQIFPSSILLWGQEVITRPKIRAREMAPQGPGFVIVPAVADLR